MAIFTENTGPNVWDWGGSPRRHPQWQYIATHRARWTAWWMIELWAVQRKSWSLIEKVLLTKNKILPSIVLELCEPKFRGDQSIDQCSNVLCLLKNMVLLHFHQIQDSDLLHRMCSQSVPSLLIINF